jgi:hypothetical protein
MDAMLPNEGTLVAIHILGASLLAKVFATSLAKM